MEEGGVTEERGGGFAGGCAKFLILAVLVVAAILGGFWLLGDTLSKRFFGPTAETVAQSSLQGLREQNRLVTFSARYVAVVTSKQTRLGLTAQKTMIMPGNVRYEVDLGKLDQRAVEWNPATRKLTVILPPVEAMPPEVDINNIRQYGEGGILMALTDAEAKLDEANRKAAQDELVRQAREPVPMRMAKDAARRAVERSFAMPLRAAGIDATVEVLFPDERSGKSTEQWDMSRNVQDVLANRW
ncbi:DUF4230 domain-containing protein [Sphingomonas canadensis]|uniref:DUF4230 domain-containing protein n=1 Tax=Sphingomonas canadensis TaxID=1219257 RepID=A0ABW3H5B4_9SPHN|nr:DUF4230 domain-containing protein [Sphingomonas canadensis]MCW3836144.1 DUF4230 domain-containing protein [Sphingomonas canadensis]